MLDEFNKNNFYVKYEIPAGRELKAWKGRASEQFDAEIGQYLPGGEYQLYIELTSDIAKQLDALPALSTGWGKTTHLYGFDDVPDFAHDVHTEKLGKYEIESKLAPSNSKTVAATRAFTANERSQDSNP